MQAFNNHGDGVGRASDSNQTGRYSVGPLAANVVGDYICATPVAVAGGPVYGYAPGCHGGFIWGGGSARPGGTPVPLQRRGGEVPGIDIALTPGGALGGELTSNGSAVDGAVYVEAYDADGLRVASVASVDGDYELDGLAPGTYRLCYSGGRSSTAPVGYQPGCIGSSSWRSETIPPDATEFVVTAEQRTTADATLTPGAGFSGRVTDAITHDPIPQAFLSVYGSSGTQVTEGETGADGTYAVGPLPPSATGYYFCVSATYAAVEPPPLGYIDRCFGNVAWNDRELAPGARAIPVAAETIVGGISMRLVEGGGLSGTVSGAGRGVFVNVFSRSGTLQTQVYTGSNGSYVVHGVTPGDHIVCFAGEGSGAPAPACVGAAWNGAARPSDAATSVRTTAGSTTSVPTTALTAGGTATGRITVAGGGTFGEVRVFDAAGNEVHPGATPGIEVLIYDRWWTVGGLAPNEPFTFCFLADHAVPTCHRGKSWDGSPSDLPAGTTPITVAAGDTAGPIDDFLKAAP